MTTRVMTRAGRLVQWQIPRGKIPIPFLLLSLSHFLPRTHARRISNTVTTISVSENTLPPPPPPSSKPAVQQCLLAISIGPVKRIHTDIPRTHNVLGRMVMGGMAGLVISRLARARGVIVPVNVAVIVLFGGLGPG